MTTENTHKVPNVPPLRFPEFSGEWEESTIGKEFELYSGNTPSRLDKENFVGDINWITSGELKEHYIGDTKEKISESSAKENNLKLMPEGTFVIAIYGLEAEGVRSTGSITTKRSTISQACMAFTPKGDISNEFLYSWYMKHGNVIGLRYAQGTKQQNLSYDIIEKFKLRYPHPIEQNKITSFIALLDKRISTQNKIIGINEIVLWQYKSKVALHEILKERNERTTINNQHPVISSTAKGLFLQSEYFEKEVASADNVGYKVLRKGNIVLSPQNLWLGNINYNDKYEKGIVSPSYKTFTISEEFNPFYVACLLKTYRALYEYTCVSEQGASIVRRNLDMEAFMEILFPMPYIDEQNRIAEGLQTIYKKLQVEKVLLDKYRMQKQYLLQQMFI